MEIKIPEIVRYLEVKNNPQSDERFKIWFRSTLLGTDLKLDLEDDYNKIMELQKVAEIFCDKIDYMINETRGGKCDMPSISRMVIRIVTKGTKLIIDQSDETNWDHTINSRKVPANYRRKQAHFRWNHTVHTLDIAYVNSLAGIIRKTNWTDDTN